MLLYGKGEEERVGNTLETTFDGRKQNVAFRGITVKKTSGETFMSLKRG